MTTHERADRNMRIVQARVRGLSWPRIAERHNVSERHARRVVAEYREGRPALHEYDAMEVVAETLEAYEAAIEDFTLLAERTDHDSTKLGAIRARLDTYHARIDLMRTIGVLPSDLGYMAVPIDLARIADRLVEVFERVEIPQPVMEQIMEALAPSAALASEPPQLAGTSSSSAPPPSFGP